jgi:hypothetical protein
VEVLDTLTNKTTVYNSISDAGQSIGCSVTAIRKALKNVMGGRSFGIKATKEKIFGCYG